MTCNRPISDFKFTQDEYNQYKNGEEILRDVPEYEGKYKMSSFGYIKSIERLEINGNHMAKINSRILIPDVSKTGYNRVTLTKDGKHKRFLVHRLAGVMFINNPENKPEINHESGDKSENGIHNLSWATSSENSLHSYKNKLREAPWIGKFGKDHNTSKEVNQYSINGIYIATFSSCKEAEDITGCSKHSISQNASGRTKTAVGFIWIYTKNLPSLHQSKND